MDVGFAISYDDECCVGTTRLDRRDSSIALEPFETFFFFDGFAVALVFFSGFLFITRPALDIKQAERSSLRRKRHGVMQQQPDTGILGVIDGAKSEGLRMVRVIQ